MEYSNTDILARMKHYGVGNSDECKAILRTVTHAILDVLDEMGKGDSLVIQNLGTIEIKLEPSVWLYLPMLPPKTRFRRSVQKRWNYVFNPAKHVERDRAARIPDDMPPPRRSPQDDTPATGPGEAAQPE